MSSAPPTLDYSRQAKPRRIGRIGLLLIVVAVALPFAGKLAGEAYLANAMKSDPLPQGAMVVAYLGRVGSIALGTALFIFGVALLVRDRFFRGRHAANVLKN